MQLVLLKTIDIKHLTSYYISLKIYTTYCLLARDVVTGHTDLGINKTIQSDTRCWHMLRLPVFFLCSNVLYISMEAVLHPTLQTRSGTYKLYFRLKNKKLIGTKSSPLIPYTVNVSSSGCLHNTTKLCTAYGLYNCFSNFSLGLPICPFQLFW